MFAIGSPLRGNQNLRRFTFRQRDPDFPVPATEEAWLGGS